MQEYGDQSLPPSPPVHVRVGESVPTFSLEPISIRSSINNPDRNPESTQHSESTESQNPALTFRSNSGRGNSREVHLQVMQTTGFKNYQIFPGNSVFFCGGRLMTSKAFWAFSIAMVILFGPSILFGIFICPWYWRNMTPAIPIIFAYAFVLAVASMIKTSWTDPGVIPRNLDKMPPLAGSEGESLGSSPNPIQLMLPPVKNVLVKDTQVELKYCETCLIYRPPRASHCRECDNCVEMEDHHCIWLNNCIGRRNYRTFFVFIVTATFLAVFVTAFSLGHIMLLYVDDPKMRDFRTILREVPVSMFLTILSFIFMFPIGYLTSFHCYIVGVGMTTHEQIKVTGRRSPGSSHPFDLGSSYKNFMNMVCRPKPKSYIARRKYALQPLPLRSVVMVEDSAGNIQSTIQGNTLMSQTPLNR
ncbi:DHHC palmitoyltransferase-domain-containing protein [Phycomyces nitens]|nr:DHHC palmitoyltransferase-domain-containing protein [Phycomyces nitens]